MKTSQISQLSLDLYNWIHAQLRESNAPTLDEMAAAMNLSSHSAIQSRLRWLEFNGWLARDGRNITCHRPPSRHVDVYLPLSVIESLDVRPEDLEGAIARIVETYVDDIESQQQHLRPAAVVEGKEDAI